MITVPSPAQSAAACSPSAGSNSQRSLPHNSEYNSSIGSNNGSTISARLSRSVSTIGYNGSVRGWSKPLPVPPTKKPQRRPSYWGVNQCQYISPRTSNSGDAGDTTPQPTLPAAAEIDSENIINHYYAHDSLVSRSSSLAVPSPATSQGRLSRSLRPSLSMSDLRQPCLPGSDPKVSMSSVVSRSSANLLYSNHESGRSFLDLNSPKQRSKFVGKLKNMFSLNDLKKERVRKQQLQRDLKTLPPPPKVPLLLAQRDTGVGDARHHQQPGTEDKPTRKTKDVPSMHVRFNLATDHNDDDTSPIIHNATALASASTLSLSSSSSSEGSDAGEAVDPNADSSGSVEHRGNGDGGSIVQGILGRFLYSIGVRHAQDPPAADGNPEANPGSVGPTAVEEAPRPAVSGGTEAVTGNEKRLRHVKSGLRALKSSVSTPLLRRPASLFFPDMRQHPVPPVPVQLTDAGSQGNADSKPAKQQQQPVAAPAKSQPKARKSIETRLRRRISFSHQKAMQRLSKARSILRLGDEAKMNWSRASIAVDPAALPTSSIPVPPLPVSLPTAKETADGASESPAHSQHRHAPSLTESVHGSIRSKGGSSPPNVCQLKRQKTLEMMRTIGDYVYIRPTLDPQNFVAPSDESKEVSCPPIPPSLANASEHGQLTSGRQRSGTLCSGDSYYYSTQNDSVDDFSTPKQSLSSISTTTGEASSKSSLEVTADSSDLSRLQMLVDVANQHCNMHAAIRRRTSSVFKSQSKGSCDESADEHKSDMDGIYTNPWVEAAHHNSKDSLVSGETLRGFNNNAAKASGASAAAASTSWDEQKDDGKFSSVGRSRWSIYKQFELKLASTTTACSDENRNSSLIESSRWNLHNNGGNSSDSDDDGKQGGGSSACVVRNNSNASSVESTCRSVYDLLQEYSSGSVGRSTIASFARTASGAVVPIVPSSSSSSSSINAQPGPSRSTNSLASESLYDQYMTDAIEVSSSCSSQLSTDSIIKTTMVQRRNYKPRSQCTPTNTTSMTLVTPPLSGSSGATSYSPRIALPPHPISVESLPHRSMSSPYVKKAASHVKNSPPTTTPVRPRGPRQLITPDSSITARNHNATGLASTALHRQPISHSVFLDSSLMSS